MCWVSYFSVGRAGGEEFKYESCTSQDEASGAMEGSFSFVPGSIAAPAGPPLAARCPRFDLILPDYIF